MARVTLEGVLKTPPKTVHDTHDARPALHSTSLSGIDTCLSQVNHLVLPRTSFETCNVHVDIPMLSSQEVQTGVAVGMSASISDCKADTEEWRAFSTGFRIMNAASLRMILTNFPVSSELAASLDVFLYLFKWVPSPALSKEVSDRRHSRGAATI